METTAWAAAAMKLLLWGALMAADLDLPPARYDHPYRGQVQYVYDFPLALADGDYLWGYTVPPKRKGGKCLIHLTPIGSVVGNQVMTEEVLQRLIRHENGHCNGWRHREEAFTLIGRDDPFIVGPENPTPWPKPPSVPPAQTTDVRQRFCVSVIEPPPSVKQDPEYDPNRWLAVREGPGAKFEVVTKMGSVGHFEADAVDGDWTHVVDPEIQGWVSSKYVQECSVTRPLKSRARAVLTAEAVGQHVYSSPAKHGEMPGGSAWWLTFCRRNFAHARRATMCLLRMILIALSAFVAGVGVAHAASLSCDEAKGHIGEQATVCGLVASAACTRSQTTFLNLCKPYPNQDFFAVIFKSDRGKFDEKLGPCEKVQEKKGCDVCVTGKIQPYQGKLEIILNDPKQLEIRRCETR